MDKKNEKTIVEKRRYYCFYDVVANDYGEPFKARTNGEALRAFHISLAQQKQKGMIANEDDYKLFYLYSLFIYEDGEVFLTARQEEVIDSELNNKE